VPSRGEEVMQGKMHLLQLDRLVVKLRSLGYPSQL